MRRSPVRIRASAPAKMIRTARAGTDKYSGIATQSRGSRRSRPQALEQAGVRDPIPARLGVPPAHLGRVLARKGLSLGGRPCWRGRRNIGRLILVVQAPRWAQLVPALCLRHLRQVPTAKRIAKAAKAAEVNQSKSTSNDRSATSKLNKARTPALSRAKTQKIMAARSIHRDIAFLKAWR
jgi:hypothetical protein